MVELICLESIKEIKDSFIDVKLRNSQSDLLFHINIKDKPAYLYLLFEHKSEPEIMTPLQLLKYKIRIWEKEKKNRTGLKKLTPIIGYVFYHGIREWKIGTSFQELYGGIDEKLKKYFLNFEYVLRNIRLLSDEEIKELFKEKKMIDPVTLEKTTAEVLIEQGMRQGMQQGIRQEKQFILIHLMNQKFSVKESEKILIKKTSGLEKLNQAIDRILSAVNKEEVLSVLQ